MKPTLEDIKNDHWEDPLPLLISTVLKLQQRIDSLENVVNSLIDKVYDYNG